MNFPRKSFMLFLDGRILKYSYRTSESNLSISIIVVIEHFILLFINSVLVFGAPPSEEILSTKYYHCFIIQIEFY